MTITRIRRISPIPKLASFPDSRRAVPNSFHTLFSSAEGAAKEHAVLVLGPVSENAASAVIARRSQRMNRTLKTIEDVSRPTQGHLKSFVVGVSADFTGFHCVLLEGETSVEDRSSCGGC